MTSYQVVKGSLIFKDEHKFELHNLEKIEQCYYHNMLILQYNLLALAMWNSLNSIKNIQTTFAHIYSLVVIQKGFFRSAVLITLFMSLKRVESHLLMATSVF